VKRVDPPKPKPKQIAKADPKAKPAPKPAHHEQKASARHAKHARPARHHAAPVPTQTAVKRAINGGHVVVLAFFQKRGADDSLTRKAVSDVKRRHLARVYTDSIDHIGRYGTVVGSLGIHQAPAVVIIDSKRHARLVEGYVDPESLAQEVSDVRK
jgi:hypothetical protein